MTSLILFPLLFSQWWTIGSAGGPAGTTGLTSASWYSKLDIVLNLVDPILSGVIKALTLHLTQVESRRHHEGMAAKSCLCPKLG